MTDRPSSIRKVNVERAVNGVLATGLTISRVEFDGGKMVIFTEEGEAPQNPLDAWRRKNGQS
jgi:hypothetical protein